ncbi:MAG: 50S ribosomal protein L29 [Patescibacteria group bacterium]
MKPNELDKKTPKEFQKLLMENRGKLQQLRFDLAAGKVKNVREIRKIRKGIAQILTAARENKNP